MAEIAENEFIWPCNCGNGDYLRMVWDEDLDYRSLWIESHNLSNKLTPLKTRIKRAFKVLFGRGYQQTEVILTEPHLTNFIEWINKTKD